MRRVAAVAVLVFAVLLAFVVGRATGSAPLTRVVTVSQEVPPGPSPGPASIDAPCGSRRTATGGGYSIGNVPFEILHDGPNEFSRSGAHVWTVTVKNTGPEPITANVYAVCILRNP